LDQVTLDRTGTGLQSTVYLEADYVVPVTLPGFDFTLHFTPESEKRFSAALATGVGAQRRKLLPGVSR